MLDEQVQLDGRFVAGRTRGVFGRFLGGARPRLGGPPQHVARLIELPEPVAPVRRHFWRRRATGLRLEIDTLAGDGGLDGLGVGGVPHAEHRGRFVG